MGCTQTHSPQSEGKVTRFSESVGGRHDTPGVFLIPRVAKSCVAKEKSHVNEALEDCESRLKQSNQTLASTRAALVLFEEIALGLIVWNDEKTVNIGQTCDLLSKR